MVDAAVMRNVAAPAQLDNLVMMGGGVHGQIKIIPVREILCVLVLAPSEHALKVTAGNVVSRRNSCVAHIFGVGITSCTLADEHTPDTIHVLVEHIFASTQTSLLVDE